MISASGPADPRRGIGEALLAVYDLLVEHYGPQQWWPGEGPGRAHYICMGAILCQNTNWGNAARALENLAGAGLTRVGDLPLAASDELADLVRPAGYFRQKARKLAEFATLCQGHGSLEGLFELPTDQLRARLLSCWGIGPETADAILLFAARRATFVVDTYAVRTWQRLGIVEPGPVSREDLRRSVLAALSPSTNFAAELHALLIQHGKNHCRAKPLCGGCPLTQSCAYFAATPVAAGPAQLRDGWAGVMGGKRSGN